VLAASSLVLLGSERFSPDFELFFSPVITPNAPSGDWLRPQFAVTKRAKLVIIHFIFMLTSLRDVAI
jgi:hypothetical protein